MSDWYKEVVEAANGANQRRDLEVEAEANATLSQSGAGAVDAVGDYDVVSMKDDAMPMDGTVSNDYAKPLTRQVGSLDARTGERLTKPTYEDPDLWEVTKWKPGDPLYIQIKRGANDPVPEQDPNAEGVGFRTLSEKGPANDGEVRPYQPRSEADIVMGGMAHGAERAATTVARGVYRFGRDVWEFSADVSDWLDGMVESATGIEMGNQPYRPPMPEQAGISPPEGTMETVMTEVVRFGTGMSAAHAALKGLALGTVPTTTMGKVTSTSAQAAGVGAATDFVVMDPQVDPALFDMARNYFAAEGALATDYTLKGLASEGPEGVMAARFGMAGEGAVLGALVGTGLRLTGKGAVWAYNSKAAGAAGDVAREAMGAGRAMWLKAEGLEQTANDAMRPMMRSTTSAGLDPTMAMWLGVWLMAKIMKGARKWSPELALEAKGLGVSAKDGQAAFNKAAKMAQKARKEAMQEWAEKAPTALKNMVKESMVKEARALLEAGDYSVTQYLKRAQKLGFSDEEAMEAWNIAAADRSRVQLQLLVGEPRVIAKPKPAGLDALDILAEPQVPIRATGDYQGPLANKKDIARDFHARSLEAVGGVARNLDDSPENIERVAQFLASEVELAARQPGSAVDWYRGSIEDYHKLASEIWPEIATDRDARLALDFVTAITSNNEKVKNNVDVAIKVYNYFREKGKMPTDLKAIGADTRNNKAMSEALGAWNTGVEKIGRQKWQQFLNTHWTTSELNALGFTTKDIEPGQRAPGSIIFGPKVGGAFFQNLEGNLDRSTIDLWYRRTYGRATGAVMTPDATRIARREKRLIAAGQSKALTQLLRTYTGRTEMPTDADTLSQVSADIFNGWARDKGDFGKNYKLGISDEVDEFHKAAREYDKAVNQPIDAPEGIERVILEKAALRSVDILSENGYNTSPADVQALLWYWEQRLWKHKGLDIDSSTDYPTELADALIKRGDLTNEQVDRVLKKRGRSDVTGGLERSSGADTRRFTGESPRKRFFKEWNGDDFRATVSDGANPDGKRQIYRVSNKGGTASVLSADGKKLSFKGKSWKNDNQRYANQWKNFGVSIPEFFEGAVADPKAATAFASAADGFRKQMDDAAAAATTPAERGDILKQKLSVAPYSAEELLEKGARVFMTKDGGAGFAVIDDDIVSVFKAPSYKEKEVGMHMLALAIQAGGRKLDNYDGPLSDIYQYVGMVPISRTPFDLKFKPPGWDARSMGKPDITFMAYNPKSDGKPVPMDRVPEYPEYDDAAAARDHVIATMRGK